MLNEVKEQTEGVAYLTRVVEGRLTSPLLLLGNEGVGRRYSVAQAAKEAFAGGDPKSNHCYQVDHGIHPDFLVCSPKDGKDIGVDEIREIIDLSYDFPAIARRRYVVVDGADRMTPAAANAFLKTLEEPPKPTQFFLLAESAESVLPTIRSRCGLVRYRPLSEAFVLEALKPFTTDIVKAQVYARLSEGSVGRALKYWGANRLQMRDRMFDLLKKGVGGDVTSLFIAVTEIGGKGKAKETAVSDDAVAETGSVADLRLGLHFLDHLLFDLSMVNHDPSRLSNLDIAAELKLVSRQIGEARITQLRHGLQAILRTRAKINLPFHVKSLLASTFVR